ncbi:PAS domain S-box protein [Desulfogranum japonicum]|uniref:PAS domain S-box protein n=1 Tax=Desulfogranum japonicum TaxID=231447 RepID=UPI00040D4081|nr:PAS domain S-box protein [Desulfogranum japonicum]
MNDSDHILHENLSTQHADDDMHANHPESGSPRRKEPVIVGIGASAGGLEAMQRLLPGLPKETDFTYVIVQHLAPDYHSILGELLAKQTDLPVENIKDKVKIKANTIYISPPSRDIAYKDSELHLIEGLQGAPKPSIDYFFTSLAKDQNCRAIGIVLSGTGSDGAHGIRAIKASGGITIAQSSDSAKFDGMPIAAIQTGNVDLTLLPEEIGPTLESLSKSPLRFKDAYALDSQHHDLQNILRLLSRKGNTDFTRYRPTTMYRRITRRAIFNKIHTLREYLDFLQENPAELSELLKDLLISVTSFFRDKQAFSALSEALRERIQDKKPNDSVRIWVPACSTGEEAYSMAIVLAELLREDIYKYKIQIFATDIDEHCVQWARKGLYPLAAILDLEQNLVDRYFTQSDNMVSVNRPLRDMVVTAKQDLLRDTPFLHLDMISCRNMLIYLESDLQAKILSLFHFCLEPDGLLFLGKSESVHKQPELFSTLDGKWKIFKRKESANNSFPALLQRHRLAQLTPAMPILQKQEKTELWKEREFTSALLAMLDCSSVLTDEHGNILFLRGDVSRYLKFSEGSVRDNFNTINMARKEIRLALQSLLNRSKKESQIVTSQNIQLKSHDGTKTVRIQVGPVPTAASPQFLVIFFNLGNSCQPISSDGEVTEQEKNKIAELEYELSATREYLQDVIEELETNSEELQSLNEELQASNEELHAANEELGTTNEELQASNEELFTVNDQLRARSEELVDAMAQLEESEKRYRQLVQNANSAIIRWRVDGTITFFNEFAQQLFGYQEEEILGKDVRILVPEHDSLGQSLTELVQDIVDNHNKYLNYVNENICRNGQRLWMTWSNKAIFDDRGNITEILAVGSDITELKSTEEELKRSQEDVRKSQKIARLGSWRLEIKTNEVSWTDALYHMFGYDPDSPPPSYKEHHKLFTQESWKKLAPAVQQTAALGIPYEFELETVRRDGSNGWVWVKGEAEKDDNGTIVGVWGAAQDITERKETEAALRILDKQRRLAFEAANLGWWQYNPVTDIATWDEGYREIFGVKKDSALNKEILNTFIHPDDLPGLLDKVSHALNPSTPENFHAQYRITRSDGTVRWVEAYGLADFSGEGADRQATELVGTVADITERKEAELTLKQSEQRLSLFIENAPVAIAMFDSEMRYINYSRRWLRDFQLEDKGNLLGCSHYDVFPELSENLRAIHERALSGEVLSGKADPMKRTTGEIQWLNWEIRPWYDRKGEIGGVIIFSEDVSQLKKAEQEQEKLFDQLNQAQKLESIGRLAGGIAHDYNNMLNVIIGYTEIAFDKISPTDPLKEDLLEISKAAQRSADITRQLLAFARKQTITPREIDLNAAIAATLKMLKHLIGENIDLIWHPGDNLWSVKIDPGQIDQILANLCVNARAAIADIGSITIETENVSIGEASTHEPIDLVPGEYVRIIVEDTGTGMSKETLDKIFEPFFTTKDIGQGTGLGLASVYGIVKQNNGAVSVTSAQGKGTTFQIYLPRHHAESVHFISSEELSSSSHQGAETILLVEDEPAILTITQRNLENSGYTVLAANSPHEALTIAEEYPYTIDVIISDVVMPEMNGRVLVDKIKASRPNLKSMYMSGYTADLIAQHGVLDDGQNFIEKPFSRERLLVKLRTILNSNENVGLRER